LRKIICWDIDGTLALTGERMIFVNTEPKNKEAFHKASVFDAPISQTLWINKILGFRPDVFNVLVTARQNKLREATEKWLLYHKVKYDQLYMKADDSGLSDSEAKRIMLKEIREKYGEPFMVFDDRHEVNEMWVNEGVYLFDVSQKETR
jgi:hypothetical protein